MLEKFVTIYPSSNINQSFLYCCDVASFHQKPKKVTTKVGKEDFFLVTG